VSDFLLSPQELGLPPKFQNWRPNQQPALNDVLEDCQEYRFLPVTMPTGSGKSPWYIALALFMGWRTIVLTRTKSLQRQLMDDFGCIGMVDIRGRANYPCRMAPLFTCEDGLHAKCPYAHDARCEYNQAKQAALDSSLVVTNYSYWPLINMFGEGLGDFDLIVLDEGAEAPQAVCDVMSVTLTAREVYHMLNKDWPANAANAGISTWQEWSRHMVGLAEIEYDAIKLHISQARGDVTEQVVKRCSQWAALVRKLKTVATAKGPWASEEHRGKTEGYRLEPLWPNEYAESVLYQGIPHVMPISATLRRKTLSLLGMEEGSYMFREYPYIFPEKRAPIYYVPTAKMSKYMEEVDRISIHYMIKQLMEPRMDRKGVILVPSYELAEEVIDRAGYKHCMFMHERSSSSVDAAIQRLRDSVAPACLVTPAMWGGYDLAYQLAEYCIIPKVPFVQIKGSKIMDARCNKKKGGDPDYADYLMAQDLQQGPGRIMRAPDDQGETMILDTNMDWVWPAMKMTQFTSWFRFLYKPWTVRVNGVMQRREKLPAPPPRLEARKSTSGAI